MAKERVLVLQLSDFQVRLLVAANAQIIAARQRMTELLHLLIGPELLQDPTLELDVQNRQLTAVREVEQEE